MPLIILAGQEYGFGSSRDWAAKGPALLGVHAIIAESYERIHRSNLIGLGILPLQFSPEESVRALGLTGHEVFDIVGLGDAVARSFTSGKQLTVRAHHPGGDMQEFIVQVRIDTPQEVIYYRHGGILPYVLRRFLVPRRAHDTGSTLTERSATHRSR